MRPESDGFTIVLNGGWNSNIIEPVWLSLNIFAEQPVELQLAIPLSTNQIRYRSGDVGLRLAQDRLMIFPDQVTDENLTRCEEVCRKICELLPHTPISAFGVNSGYAEQRAEGKILELLTTSDRDDIARFGGLIGQTEIHENFTVDGEIYNHKVVQTEQGGIELHLNHHVDLTTVADLIARPQGFFVAHKILSERFFAEVYELNLDEGEEDD